MNPTSNSTNLFKKLIEVRKEIKSVKKSGYNKHQNYNYVTEADLVEAIRESLNKHGVLLFTSSEITDIRDSKKFDKDKGEIINGVITSVRTSHTFIDSETGESHSVMSSGSGHDTLGDKSVFKAITGSYKYMLSKNFLIESDDDPENDGETTQKPVITGFNKVTTSQVNQTSAQVLIKPEETNTP